MTNAIPVVQMVAGHAGFNLNGEEIGALISAGGLVIRWVQLEGKAIIAAGGLRAIWSKLVGPKQPGN